MGIDVEQLTESQQDKEVTVNDATGRLEGALANLVSIATADADVDLSASAASKLIAFSNFYFRLTGAMTATRGLVLPDGADDGKTYFVENATTGGFAITVQRASGATVSVPAGESRLVYNDGTDVLDLINTSLSIAASTVTYDPGSPAKFDGESDVQAVLDLLAPIYEATEAFDVDSNVVTDSSGALVTLGGTREVLVANRTYYVRTDGSDSNDGLSNSAGGAFLTIQRAVTVIGGLDLATFTVTIKLGNAGTYGAFSVAGPWVGAAGSLVVLDGDTASPGSYVIGGTTAITVSDFGRLDIQGVDLTTTSVGLSLTRKGLVRITGAMIFGTCTNIHMAASNQSLIQVLANYTVDGAAARHFDCDQNSVIRLDGRTVTLSGTLNFSSVFALCSSSSTLFCVGASFTGGTITGTRWSASLNGTIHTGGVGPDTMFPGDVAGSSTTGGQTA